MLRRGGRVVLPVVSQSVVTSVSSAMSEISSTLNFRVPARDLESLLASSPILRATSLWLIPAVLMASRTRVSSDVSLVSASLLVATTHTVCTQVAILAMFAGVLMSFLDSTCAVHRVRLRGVIPIETERFAEVQDARHTIPLPRPITTTLGSKEMMTIREICGKHQCCMCQKH